MMISIIVPMYNAHRTISRCLDALCQQMDDQCELIVVDDCSDDGSHSLANKFDVNVLLNPARLGVSYSRNRGVEVARGEIIVFVDSDVVVSKDAIAVIRGAFSSPSLWGITGILSVNDLGLGFFSHYKNCYMNYILRKKVGSVGFLYGSICAIRRDTPVQWDESIAKGEDTVFGQEMVARGLEVTVIPELCVDHYKQYSFLSLLKNDFIIPFHFFSHFVQYLMLKKNADHNRGFSHVSFEQLCAITSVALSILIFLLPTAGALKMSFISLALLLWSFFNFRYFAFLYKNFQRKRLTVLLFTYIDQFTMGMGILIGCISWPFRIWMNQK